MNPAPALSCHFERSEKSPGLTRDPPHPFGMINSCIVIPAPSPVIPAQAGIPLNPIQSGIPDQVGDDSGKKKFYSIKLKDSTKTK